MFLHVLGGTVGAGTGTVAFGFAGSTAVAAGTKRHVVHRSS